jgi:hypothetical protein
MMGVKTKMSDIECTVWGAEFTRVRAGDSAHAAVGAGIDSADQAVIDLRNVFSSEHGPLTMLGLSPLERAVWAAEFIRMRANEGTNIKAARQRSSRSCCDRRTRRAWHRAQLTHHARAA